MHTGRNVEQLQLRINVLNHVTVSIFTWLSFAYMPDMSLSGGELTRSLLVTTWSDGAADTDCLMVGGGVCSGV